ncbi:MAG: VPGUxxT family thioredoxin-like (seleno)protein, type 2 [Myxococcota bacterium]
MHPARPSPGSTLSRPWLALLGAALAGLAASSLLGAAPADAGDAPRELGRVDWNRDFEAGIAQAQQTERPVFLLFQEVPGCSTCVNFGEGALSHALMVEAIETAFVPVAVFNNKGGEDAAVLRRYREPSWNNPVVRFVDASGADLIPRRDGVYHTSKLAPRMRAALAAANRPVPAYLDWLIEEHELAPTAQATFVTHCFWEGEVCFGSDPAVRKTRASWHQGREVVEVWFDPAQTTYEALVERAKARGCADAVVSLDASQERIARGIFGNDVLAARGRPRKAPEKDQKRHLRASKLRGLELTALQATRVNAALADRQDPRPWLSPRQRAQVGL